MGKGEQYVGPDHDGNCKEPDKNIESIGFPLRFSKNRDQYEMSNRMGCSDWLLEKVYKGQGRFFYTEFDPR
ncbi:hypothetical protein OGAPHI_001315 [Ogataea philodendri]|uniref:Uncharacterized protein n=1 Tax=Ogataea philodendri TaxID=1378263 RepID=A0A9P8PGE1_9ASCO|nr:uncharacterized protein OGAPHI_001315 [Ogataea philodendri]KAH3670799.1 hypothetical protein OGAPHI_001315 [Ogataea philodendri]